MRAIGLIGTAFAALCCFTPLLPILLGAIGLGAWVPAIYSDAVLLPILGFFVVITLISFWRKRRT